MLDFLTICERKALEVRLTNHETNTISISCDGFGRGPEARADMRKCLGIAAMTIGLALCGAGLWILLRPAVYEATTRVQITVPTHPDAESAPDWHDPYFVETEFQVMQSHAILDRVVDTLHLNEEWGKAYGGGVTLKTPETVSLLKQKLHFRHVGKEIVVARITADGPTAPQKIADNVDISVTDEDPVEAAKIANAIAETYRDFRNNHVAPALKMDNPVTVVTPATPPSSPMGPPRWLGVVSLLCGLASCVRGYYLICTRKAALSRKP